MIVSFVEPDVSALLAVCRSSISLAPRATVPITVTTAIAVKNGEKARNSMQESLCIENRYDLPQI